MGSEGIDRVTAVVGSGNTGNPVTDFMINGVHDILAEVDVAKLTADCASALADAFHAPIPMDFHGPDGLLRSIDAWHGRVQEADATQLLQHLHAFSGYRFAPDSPALPQLRYGLDALVNDCVVRHVVEGLRDAMDSGRITDGECRAIAGMLGTSGSGGKVNAIYLEAIERTILAATGGHGEVHLLSIGCGRGNNDAEIFRAMRERHPDIQVRIIGFDAHQNIHANPIVAECGGIVVNRELPDGWTYLDMLRGIETVDPSRVVATERYALHHMNRSLETLLSDLEDVPLVSVDHPAGEEVVGSLEGRAAMAAYDLLSAQVRTAGFGGGWVPAAMRDPKVFSILYRRRDDVEADMDTGVTVGKVGGKIPPTWVMGYPAGWRLVSTDLRAVA